MGLGRGQALWNGGQYIGKEQVEKNSKIFDNALPERYIEVYEEVLTSFLVLDIDCQTKDGDDAIIPKVKFVF